MNKLKWNKEYTWLKTGACLILCLSLIFSIVGAGITGNALADEDNTSADPYVVRKFIDDEGREIGEEIYPGRPPEVKAAAVTVPEPDPFMGTNTIPNVPAFDWCYGCSATSAAMMFGYYDNVGYSNMYTGPTNGGVCPMDNTVWVPSGECPLSATHQGYDGLVPKGHVDDYWVAYGAPGPDPYFSGAWTQHTHGDCTADYMGTSQWNNLSAPHQNTDGSTRFWYYESGAPMVDYTWPESVGGRDGCHGMRLFAESRGYSVNTNYHQRIYGYPGTTGGQGFTYDNYKAQIDAGRPVIIQVEGHSMLGTGYNDPDTVYLHDTWDHAQHSMTWGGLYYPGALQHKGVVVLELDPLGSVPAAPGSFTATTYSTSQIDLSWTKGGLAEKTMVRWSISSYPTTPGSGTQGYFGPGTSWQHTGLPPGTPCYYSAWSHVEGSDIWSTTYVTAQATTTALVPPTVTTGAATGVEETTATGHGDITSTGSGNCDKRGVCWSTSSSPDITDSKAEETGSFGTGAFSASLTGLSEGTKYYVRAYAHNSAGYSYGNEVSFLSKPEAPASFLATNFDTTRIDLSWTKGAGAQKTKIQRKVGSYPVDRTDGTQVYFDTGTAVSDTGLTPDTAYYYRAWSFVEGSEQWSDTYAQASAGTFSGYAIDLTAGWNLVSLPMIPGNTDIDAVISAGNLASGNAANIALAYHYNTTAGIWMWWNGTLAGNLHTMEDGLGYWLYATVADTLTVHGTEAGHPGPDYPVFAGWNMIGFTSTSNMAPETYLASEDGNYSLLYRWAGGGWWWWMKNTPASTFTNMEPGYGYWLFMNADGIITPP